MSKQANTAKANGKDMMLLDGIKWWVAEHDNGDREPVALCPKHHLRLSWNRRSDKMLFCAEGPHVYSLPRSLDAELSYVIDKLDSLVFSKMSILNLDEEAVLVAKEDLKDENYWVRAKVTESKSGPRLVVWAGDRSKKNKAQLFIEPSLKRMSFDQNDDHPLEVFAKVEATFADGVKATMGKSASKGTPAKKKDTPKQAEN